MRSHEIVVPPVAVEKFLGAGHVFEPPEHPRQVPLGSLKALHDVVSWMRVEQPIVDDLADRRDDEMEREVALGVQLLSNCVFVRGVAIGDERLGSEPGHGSRFPERATRIVDSLLR